MRDGAYEYLPAGWVLREVSKKRPAPVHAPGEEQESAPDPTSCSSRAGVGRS
jgi:hypothetical protein